MRALCLVQELMSRERVHAACAAAGWQCADGDAPQVRWDGIDVVFADLGEENAWVRETLATRPPAVRLFAWYPHVRGDLREAGRVLRADVIVPRSRFFRDPLPLLRSVTAGETIAD